MRTHWFLLALSLPVELPMWGVAAFIRLVWGMDWFWSNGTLNVILAPDSWMNRVWGKAWAAMTLGHVVIYSSNREDDANSFGRTAQHEAVHVRQFEDDCLRAALLLVLGFAAMSPWWVAVALWWTHPWISWLLAHLAAAIRGGDVYADSMREVSARAISRTRYFED